LPLQIVVLLYIAPIHRLSFWIDVLVTARTELTSVREID
jgi:hypothetical protein